MPFKYQSSNGKDPVKCTNKALADDDKNFLDGIPKQCWCDDIDKVSMRQIGTMTQLVEQQEKARLAMLEMKELEEEAKRKAKEEELKRQKEADRLAAQECAAKKVMEDLIKADAAADAKEAKERAEEEARDHAEQMRLDQLEHDQDAKE